MPAHPVVPPTRPWIALGSAALIAKALLLVVLAWNSRFVMDEFWHISQPNYLFNGFFDTIQPEKAVGYAVFFKLAHLFGQDSATIMLAGRVLCVALAFGLIATVYGHARALCLSRGEALLSVLLLLSFSNFMERSFELRSEPLAILFAALSLLVVIRGTADGTRSLLLAGILCGLSFVTTQKAVYFNVALGAGLVIDALLAGKLATLLRRAALLFLGWVSAVVVYTAVFGGLHPGPVLKALFLGPLEVAASAQNYYTDLRMFVAQTLTRNAPLYLLSLTGLALSVLRLRRSSSPLRIHAVFATIITVLVFLHNQPWPYVFTMAVPFLAPYAVMGLQAIAARISVRLLIPILLIGVIAASFQRNLLYLARSNVEQLAVVRDAERLLPDDGTYFDGIGMLPARRMEPYIWLDAMGTAKTLRSGPSSPFAQSFFASPPDMVILSYRTDDLLPILGSFLANEYERVTDDLMIKKQGTAPQAAPADTHTRRNLFKGIYSY